MSTTEPATEGKPTIPASAHLASGWPLILVIVGGAIGGLLGGLAYAINLQVIYPSKFSLPLKILLNLITGFTAIVLWVVIVVAIQMWLKK